MERSMYGILSWLMQVDCPRYEVIVLHCTEYGKQIKDLKRHKSENCSYRVKRIDTPDYFNLAAFRNLGIYYANGENVCIASVDIIRRSDFLKNINYLLIKNDCWISAGSFHIPKHTDYLADVNSYNQTNKFDVIMDTISKDFKYKHTIDYGTSIVKKEHITSIGGYDDNILFHEDADIDRRADFYFRERGVEHPIIRTTDTKKYPGAKLKGIKKIDMRSHGMLIKHSDKKASRQLMFEKESSGYKFTPLNMDEEYLMSRLYASKRPKS